MFCTMWGNEAEKKCFGAYVREHFRIRNTCKIHEPKCYDNFNNVEYSDTNVRILVKEVQCDQLMLGHCTVHSIVADRNST